MVVAVYDIRGKGRINVDEINFPSHIMFKTQRLHNTEIVPLDEHAPRIMPLFRYNLQDSGTGSVEDFLVSAFVFVSQLHVSMLILAARAKLYLVQELS